MTTLPFASRTISKMMLTNNAFRLLREFERNNRRDWYQKHKSEIDALLTDPFRSILEETTNLLEGTSFPLRGSALTMFRMQRDLRFTRDKTPYKPHVSGMLTLDGTKSTAGPMAYLRLASNGGFAAIGYYHPDSARLSAIRTWMTEESEDWSKHIDQLAALGRSLDMDGMLLGMPRGFGKWSNSMLAPHLKLKSFICKESFSYDAWCDGEVPSRLVQLTLQCMPFFSRFP